MFDFLKYCVNLNRFLRCGGLSPVTVLLGGGALKKKQQHIQTTKQPPPPHHHYYILPSERMNSGKHSYTAFYSVQQWQINYSSLSILFCVHLRLLSLSSPPPSSSFGQPIVFMIVICRNNIIQKKDTVQPCCGVLCYCS